jgi:hypothetical protein
MVWFVPVGVLTARSIKASPFRGRTAWARIARVTERRRRGSTSIQPVLKDGKTVACRIPLSEIGELQQLAAPGTAAGYGAPLTGPQTQPPVSSNTWSTLAFICAGIDVLLVPIVVGPVAFVCARVASYRRESRARGGTGVRCHRHHLWLHGGGGLGALALSLTSLLQCAHQWHSGRSSVALNSLMRVSLANRTASGACSHR